MPVSYGDDKSLIVSLSCESGPWLDSVVGCTNFVLRSMLKTGDAALIGY